MPYIESTDAWDKHLNWKQNATTQQLVSISSSMCANWAVLVQYGDDNTIWNNVKWWSSHWIRVPLLGYKRQTLDICISLVYHTHIANICHTMFIVEFLPQIIYIIRTYQALPGCPDMSALLVTVNLRYGIIYIFIKQIVLLLDSLLKLDECIIHALTYRVPMLETCGE